MKIIINDEEIQYEEGRNTAEVLAEIVAFINRKNLVVTEQKVNGTAINVELDQIMQLEDIDLIELNVNTRENLVFEGMHTAKTFVPVLQERIREVVVLLQEGRDGEGINIFIELLEGLEWFQSLIQGMQLQEGICREEFGRKVVSYNEILTQLLKGMENRDMVLISDLLEYEVLPFMDVVLEEIGMATGDKEMDS